jgi:acyl carrier protein
VLPAIPMNANGKVDRGALAAPESVDEPTHAAPRTPTETQLAAIWAEVLGAKSVSVDAGFLDLGGHSLLAIRILGRVRRDLGVIVPLETLLRGATIAAVGEIVDAMRAAPPEIDEDDFDLAPVSRDAFRRTRATSGERA